MSNKGKLLNSAAAVTAAEPEDQHEASSSQEQANESERPHERRPSKPQDERPEACQRRLLGGYCDEDELAGELGVTKRTLRLWRMRRTGPPWGRLGKKVIYRIDGVRTWLAGLDKPQHGRRAA